MRRSIVVKKIMQAYALVQEWRVRARTRGYLSAMSSQMLHDIGVDEVERWNEVRKPFWRC